MSEAGEPETWVTFPTGARVPLSWRYEQARQEVIQSRLERAHGLLPRPHCDCRLNGKPLEVVVVRRTSAAAGGSHVRFHLARMPQDGPLHRPTCFFHEAEPDRSGAAAYTQGVVEQHDDGTTSLRLSRSLRIAQKPDPDDEAPLAVSHSNRAGKSTRRAMTPLGLLHLLWERAGLNQWHPGFAGKRQLSRVGYRIEQAAREVLCGRIPLHEQLAFVVPNSVDRAAALVRLVRSASGQRYVVLSGVVRAIDRAKERIELNGALPPYNLFLKCDLERQDDLRRRFPYAHRLLDQPSADRPALVVGLFVVKARTSSWKERLVISAELELGALMEVTRDFVPVASALEQRVADRLIAEGRQFEKPLRYDAGQDLVFPDFVLLDTGHARGLPMEVFGRDDEAYRARQAEKERYYQETYGVDGSWQWNAAGSEQGPIPAFPEARSTRHSPHAKSA